jgi:hypothetical protein
MTVDTFAHPSLIEILAVFIVPVLGMFIRLERRLSSLEGRCELIVKILDRIQGGGKKNG